MVMMDNSHDCQNYMEIVFHGKIFAGGPCLHLQKHNKLLLTQVFSLICKLCVSLWTLKGILCLQQ